MSQFSIKDLAGFSGLKQHTIRMWEQRYSFLHPKRTSTALRTYTAEELNVLLDVVLLNQEGYKLARIDKMSLEEKIKVFSEVVNQQQKTVHELIIQMARMDAEGFELALDSAVLFWGIQVAMQQILFPFFQLTGFLQASTSKNYLANTIVVSQVIKQKLYVALEKAKPSAYKNKKVVLFSLSPAAPALTLLYFQYLLKIEGYQVVHLGILESMDHLPLICQHTNPQYVITHVGDLSGKTLKQLGSFVKHLPLELPACEFVILEHPLEACKEPHCKYAENILNALNILERSN